MANAWNPDLYSKQHAFVWEAAGDLLGLLNPQPGERILDVGCGTGQLTARIAEAGAQVTGVDSSASMLEPARRDFPQISWLLADARKLHFPDPFDAVFSNAALHWIPEARQVAESVAGALRGGGRFVAEFGGHGNVETIVQAAIVAGARQGVNLQKPWYFPHLGEYANLLESVGLEVTFALLFDRPTRLEDPQHGLRNWMRMFGGPFLVQVPDPERFLDELVTEARPVLERDGVWWADYRRLRITAIKR